MNDQRTGWLRLAEHDRVRLRATRRLVLAGVGLGVVAAAGFAAAGFDGRVGFALVMIGTAFGAVAAALLTVVMAIVDEARRDPVAIARILISLGLFGLGAILLAGVAGLAGVNA